MRRTRKLGNGFIRQFDKTFEKKRRKLMKKKLIAVAAAALMVVALAGCSSSASSASGSASASGSGSALPGDGSSLNFVTGGESGTYYAVGGVIALSLIHI